jgi:ribonuclease HII
MNMPNFRIERDLRKRGLTLVAGLDEAGRGAWAGPLYAAAVILPLDEPETILQLKNEGVRDGKRISSNRREKLCEEVVKKRAIAWGAASASAREIDELGLTTATHLAMERALEDLSTQPEYLLIDGHYFRLPSIPEDKQESFKQGELQARCIAAASIVAKVERDRFMRELDETYPGYGFAQHKGYGTQMHRSALKKLKPCPEHRKSFKPVAVMLDGAKAVE